MRHTDKQQSYVNFNTDKKSESYHGFFFSSRNLCNRIYCSMQQNILLYIIENIALWKVYFKISVKNKNDLNKFVERKSPKHDKLLSMTQDSKPKGQAWGTIEDV